MFTQTTEFEFLIIEDESLADVGGGSCVNGQ